MSKVMLRLRDLTTGDGKPQEFEDVEAAIVWLKERPKMTECLGVVFEGLTREDNDRMRNAMRPLDPEEHTAANLLDAKERAERDKRAEARRIEAQEGEKAAREAAKTADPNRPMEVRYRYNEAALSLTDTYDTREITEEAKSAVMAFVAERTEWVEGRGQIVGEAKVTVYPGPVPKGKDRIVQGTFVPVTAPPKAT